MKFVFSALAAVMLFSAFVSAQTKSTSIMVPSSRLDAASTARAALAAHGGQKLKALKSMAAKGSVEINVSNQTLPGTFSTAFSGDKYYFEISSVIQQLTQVYDGQQTYSSIPGFSLPPFTSLGFPLLSRIGDEGYVIAELADKKKKGFRMTTPDGFYTDFLVDDKTGQIKGYESSYVINNRTVTTSVEIDEFQTLENITFPKKFSQRFDLGAMTAYATFKTKDVLINSAIDDSAFALPK